MNYNIHVNSYKLFLIACISFSVIPYEYKSYVHLADSPAGKYSVAYKFEINC